LLGKCSSLLQQFPFVHSLKKKLQSVALPKKSSTMPTTGFGGQFLRHPGSGKVTMLKTRVGLDSAQPKR